MQHKYLRLIFGVISVFVIIGLIISFYCSAAPSSNSYNNTYLFLGLDDAAQNADSIMLVRFEANRGMIIMQIPRDTYCKYGKGQNKLNGLFPFLRSRVETASKALEEFTRHISKSFGISIDGAFALTRSSFCKIIDQIGGVKIRLENQQIFVDDNSNVILSLAPGEHVLDSEAAELFVRHRKGYSFGDLSRMDVQKTFIAGFVNTCNSISPITMLNVYEDIKNDLISTVSISKELKNAIKYLSRVKELDIVCFTAPGEPIYSKEGISYYSLNFFAMRKTLEKLFSSTDFDSDKQFLKQGDIAFENIYFDDNFNFKIPTS